MRKFLVSVVGAALLLGGASAARPAPAEAGALPPTLTIVGHGWGHGRGMGMYGALGYALSGWSYQQILAHYYGGTALATVASRDVNVHLSELDGAPSVTVTAWPGTHLLVNGALQAASTLTVSRGSADRTITDSAGKDLTVSGPWYTGPTRNFAGSVVVKASVAQVWNVVPLDAYVEGVVPRESPASWPQAALQAQAVAARSFGLAYLAGSPSVCDTDWCQVYGGDPTQYPFGDAAASNAAVTSTALEVVECGSDRACGSPAQVALTQFSSSSGGYTYGGAFPAVVDAGDSTPTNPNHNWSVSVPTSQVQAAYPSVGTLLGITVTSRNGLGDLGGRVMQMTISGTAGRVSVTGEQFEWALGLKSDWFAITDITIPAGSDTGYWVVDSAGGVHAYGNAGQLGSVAGSPTSAPIVGMAATSAGKGYWEVGADGSVAPFGNAVSYGSMKGIALNAPVLGMAGTPDGAGYWEVAGDGGVFTFGDARFYGSTGNLALWKPVVGMVRTADGKGYWLVGADGGIFTFGDAPFVGSLPGLGISDTITSVSPTPDQHGYVMVGASGHVYSFGDATYLGDPASDGGSWSADAVGVVVPRP